MDLRRRLPAVTGIVVLALSGWSLVGCGQSEPTAPATSTPAPSTTTTTDQPAAGVKFAEISRRVSGGEAATFTARYAGKGGGLPSEFVLVRQPPVTALLANKIRTVWTAQDVFLCRAGGSSGCVRQGAPSAHASADADWAAVLADAGLAPIGPKAAWLQLERTWTGTTVTESVRTIAGQESACVTLATPEDAEFGTTNTTCFLANGVVSYLDLVVKTASGTQKLTAELTDYQDAADAAAVTVPADAPIG